MKTSTQVFAFSLVMMLMLASALVGGGRSASAQFLGGGPGGVSLLLSPQFPQAFEKVRVSLDDYSVDTVGADIVWFVDGIKRNELQNGRSIELEAGDLGSKRSVRVELLREGAGGMSASVDIVPAQIDVILESNTYVPTFYRGRALPSPESKVRAIAVVHDGTRVPDTAYTYKWSENGTVLFGGPVKGKNAVEFTTSLYGNRSLTVEVMNGDGATIGKKTVALETHPPEIHFYEESPLRGLLEKTTSDPLPLIGEELTVYGEPYFLNTGVQSGEVEFRWRINSEVVTSENEMPNSITLRHAGGIGRAEVTMDVRSTGRIPRFIERAFTIFFE